MGLLRKLFGMRSQSQGASGGFGGNATASAIAGTTSRVRVCRFEPMEERQLLSASSYSAAPIHVGVVYFEPMNGGDVEPNVFHVSFHGGAEGTQLTRLVINTDRDGNGLTKADPFFDIAPGGLGSFGHSPFKVVSSNGITVVDYHVQDGGQELIIYFSGFDAGKQFVFSIDVDEMGLGSASSPIVEGAEFERSRFTASFTAPHYAEESADATFRDVFNFSSKYPELAKKLPNDNYNQNICWRDKTAGAATDLQQTPLPITIAGTVFEDFNLNNQRDPGDHGISGVTLTLWKWDQASQSYKQTNLTTQTDAQGAYKFTDVMPGLYQIRQTQPTGYIDVGASVGSIGGVARGSILNVNILSGIELFGGDNGVSYDFAEARCASLSGYVYHDRNNNGIREAGEEGIGGATVRLHYEGPLGTISAITLTTAADGSWMASGLPPGHWRIEEVTPAGWLDGLDRAGTAGGTAHNPGDLITGIFLGSGQIGTDYLFGELKPNLLCGYVYEDQNGNGILDSGDTPISGVTVALYDEYGFVADTLTDADGRYCFGPLPAGVFTIVETTPAGYLDGPDFVGTAGGVITANDTISQIVLTSDIRGENYNFLEVRAGSIRGRVVEDLDANGALDPGEPPIAGVRVELLNSSGQVIKTQYTDANGAYAFTDLMPGVYTVRETTPVGYQDGDDLIGTAGGALIANDTIGNIVITSGLHASEYNFLEYRFGGISGRVMIDSDGDGQIDANPVGIPGVKVELLSSSGSVLHTTLTDSQGHYAFNDLMPGCYGVRETTPAGMIDGADFVGTAGGTIVANDRIGNIAIYSGTQGRDYDFLEIEPSSIRGRVIEDLNGNGAIDPGEPPIAGVLVELLDLHGNVIDMTLTDANGAYAFTHLLPGTYTVRETDPPGFIDGAELIGSHGGHLIAPDKIAGIVLVSGTMATEYNFLELRTSSLRGRVMVDTDGDGQIDAHPIGIYGVQVELLNAGGQVIRTTTTDADGYYQFVDLMPGVYTIRETTPAGWHDGADFVGTAGGTLSANDTISGIIIVSNTHGTHYDFLEIEYSRITGHVYVDLNGNGEIDPGEPPLPGAKVELLDASGNVLATTYASTSGYYAFTELLPGIYGVRETTPDGYFNGNNWVGTAGGMRLDPDSIVDIALTSGTWADQYDFLELLPVNLSGHVYEDLNDDGFMDPNESGIAGVVLHLLNAAGQRTGQTAVTNAGGYYQFTGLDPRATYGLEEIQPAGYFDGKDTPGNRGGTALPPDGDRITGIVMTPGVHAEQYNFGEIPPSTIRGRVHAELNGDGVWQSDEPLLAGVTIKLLNAQGGIVATTTTDSQGRYQFTNLRSGIYQIEEVQPAGYLQGAATPGSIGGTAQTPDLIVGIHLGVGVHAVNYDFWEAMASSISGYVFQDGETIVVPQGQSRPPLKSVRDGQFQHDNPRLAGVRLILADGSGVPLQDDQGRDIITTTNAQGYYEFSMLPPGLYTVLQVHPAGYDDGIDTPGTTGGIVYDPESDLYQSSGIQQVWTTIRQLGFDPADAIARIAIPSFGTVSQMNNFSEVRYVDVPTPPPSPWNPKIPSLNPPGPNPTFGEPSLIGVIYTPSPIMGTGSMGYGGGGAPMSHTWHLSIINAGSPRAAMDPATARALAIHNVSLAGMHGTFFDPTLWRGPSMNQGRWIFPEYLGINPNDFVLGRPGAIPLAGDFNGDGVDQLAVFINGVWFIDLNGNGRWDEGDLWIKMGGETDQPVIGDWDGDGKDDIGVFGVAWEGDNRALAVETGLPDKMNMQLGNPKNVPPSLSDAVEIQRIMKTTSTGQFRSDVIDHVFDYGTEGDIAISGDWNGDGVTNIGLYRKGTWFLDANGNGRFDSGDIHITGTGERGDIPVVGDWNGDGIDNIGLFRDGRWIIDSNGDGKLDHHDRVFHLGGPGDRPVVGDFNGDGIDDPAVFRPDGEASGTTERISRASGGSRR